MPVLDLARKSNELAPAVDFGFEGCKLGARGFKDGLEDGDDQLRSSRSSMVMYAVCQTTQQSTLMPGPDSVMTDNDSVQITT